MGRLILFGLLITIAVLFSIPAIASAQDGWLASPLTPWNEPAMAIPAPPPELQNTVNPLCLTGVRPAETPEDEAVGEQGWLLFGSYQGGWDLRVIGGTAGFDGMCRPNGYQYFVFLSGAFVGTISPEPMLARSTGSGRVVSVNGEHMLTATFVRYADSDPLCCPSRPSITVDYRVELTDDGPVLAPWRSFESN